MAETFEQYTARILSFATHPDPLDVLRQTPSRIGAMIAARPDADLRWTPTADRWSIAQILAHLADVEIVSGYRIRMILSAPGTPIQAFDQNGWARALHYENRDAFASLSLFRSVRASLVALLESLDDEALDRFGMHAERGKESVRYLMRLNSGHDLNHVAQIERLLAEQDRQQTAVGPVPPARHQARRAVRDAAAPRHSRRNDSFGE